MKLLTFSTDKYPNPRIGVLRGEDIVDVGSAALQAGIELVFDSSDMTSLIQSGQAGLDQVKQLLDQYQTGTGEPTEVKIHAPIPNLKKNIFCVGWNYVEHYDEGEQVRQTGQDMPTNPTFFSKATTTLNTASGDVSCDPALSGKFDWEVELGVIIGKTGKSIPEENAMDHIFGYTVINDITVRNAQKFHGGQWFKGKSYDGTCPMGPYIVTADEIADPQDLPLICRVNDVVKQDSSTKYMYFKIPQLIASLSWGLTIEAGDILSTGTPPGVGFARNPPEYLQPGDVVECEIPGIGKTSNKMI